MKTSYILPLCALFTACPPPTEPDADTDTALGTDVDTDSDSDIDSDIDTDSDTERTACLTYPVPSAPIGRQAEAQTALAALDADGTLTWNAVRDAPSGVTFDVALPECTDDAANLYEAVWAVVEAHPDAFLIDRADWGENAPAPCSIVAAGRVRTLQFYRERVGSVPVARDIFSAVLRRTDDGVRLQGVTGTWLPPATEALDAELAACPDLEAEDVESVVLSGSYDYTTFFQCTGTGTGTYMAQPTDGFALTEDPVWSWYESDGQVLFEKTVGGQFLVDESRWSSELLSSDAYCPGAEDRVATVGWRLQFDAVTGEWLSAMPGIGCLVC